MVSLIFRLERTYKTGILHNVSEIINTMPYLALTVVGDKNYSFRSVSKLSAVKRTDGNQRRRDR